MSSESTTIHNVSRNSSTKLGQLSLSHFLFSGGLVFSIGLPLMHYFNNWLPSAASIGCSLSCAVIICAVYNFVRVKSKTCELATLQRTRLQSRNRLNSEYLQLFLTDRDFNSNDYEALLLLDDSIPLIPMISDSDINRLPIISADSSCINTASLSNGSCSICLQVIESGDKLRIIPCFHKFHPDCIDPWLKAKAACPICKCSVLI